MKIFLKIGGNFMQEISREEYISRINQKKTDAFTDNQVKPHPALVIKHHKEKGNKGEHNNKNRIGEII